MAELAQSSANNEFVRDSDQADDTDVLISKDPQTEQSFKVKSCWHKVPIIGFITSLFEKYDSTFILLLGMQFLNQGFKALTALATKDLFKSVYGMEPSTVQQVEAFIVIPWSIKLLYGLISDNLPLFG